MTTLRGLRVLVVGENPETREILAGSFRAAGHVVGQAANRLLALEAAEATRPDVVFLDINRPGEETYEVARIIQEQALLKRPLLVALSGAVNREEAYRRSREVGIDLHLLKPIDLEKIHGLLQRFRSVVEDVEAFDPVI